MRFAAAGVRQVKRVTDGYATIHQGNPWRLYTASRKRGGCVAVKGNSWERPGTDCIWTESDM